MMNYRLANTAGGWKIYDISVLGVWLIETYRNSFAAEVHRGSTDGLIRVLSERNNRIARNRQGSQRAAG